VTLPMDTERASGGEREEPAEVVGSDDGAPDEGPAAAEVFTGDVGEREVTREEMDIGD